jgi:hypothetical protein
MYLIGIKVLTNGKNEDILFDKIHLNTNQAPSFVNLEKASMR